MTDARNIKITPINVDLGNGWTATAINVEGEGLSNPLALVTLQNAAKSAFVRLDLGKVMFLDTPDSATSWDVAPPNAQARKVFDAWVRTSTNL